MKFCSIYDEYDGDVEIYNNSNPELIKKNFITMIEAYAVKSYNIMIKNKYNCNNVDLKKHQASLVCPECNYEYDSKNYKVNTI